MPGAHKCQCTCACLHTDMCVHTLHFLPGLVSNSILCWHLFTSLIMQICWFLFYMNKSWVFQNIFENLFKLLIFSLSSFTVLLDFLVGNTLTSNLPSHLPQPPERWNYRQVSAPLLFFSSSESELSYTTTLFFFSNLHYCMDNQDVEFCYVVGTSSTKFIISNSFKKFA